MWRFLQSYATPGCPLQPSKHQPPPTPDGPSLTTLPTLKLKFALPKILGSMPLSYLFSRSMVRMASSKRFPTSEVRAYPWGVLQRHPEDVVRLILLVVLRVRVGSLQQIRVLTLKGGGQVAQEDVHVIVGGTAPRSLSAAPQLSTARVLEGAEAADFSLAGIQFGIAGCTHGGTMIPLPSQMLGNRKTLPALIRPRDIA